MANEPKRKKRPLPAERLLRQEAGYGCCKCGHPIFQYHHILPYTEGDPHYRPADMMVLCPNCHDEATQGVLTEAEQRTHKAEPFNLIHGRATGALRPRHSEAEIVFGNSVAMLGQGSLLEIDGHSLLGLKVGDAGDLCVSVDLYDQEDVRLAQIVENVWEAGDPLPWDLDYGYRYLSIRRAKGAIALELDLRGDEPHLRADLWRHGKRLTVGNNGIEWEGGGGIKDLTLDGLAVQWNTVEGTIAIGPPRREPSRTRESRLGRNDPCWCGSGVKHKKCHGA